MNRGTLYIIGLLCVFCFTVKTQTIKGPAAKFSFNDKKDYDEVSGKKAKLVGVNFTYDRFENKNNAAYFHGNASSYINLGNYKALKPKVGSISLWVKVDGEIWSGTGREMNPIIITKNSLSSNFNEAYYIAYFPDMNKIAAFSTQDSLNQVVILDVENFELVKWHHLVMTYDDHDLSFYIDGKLGNRLPKPFETKFLETDSVMLGVTASKKNNRFLQGAIDDVEFYDRVLTDTEVEALYTAPDPNRTKIILKWALIVLIALFVIVGIYFFMRHRLNQAMKKEKEKLRLTNTVLETELRINRALMNPHFVFNSLNTLHNFILTSENDHASDYLIKFSQLIRKLLESNMQDFITLEVEIEILEQYLEIESFRFEENIQYRIVVDENLVPSTIQIPVMMLQPFVENAIWHGLLNKQGDKIIHISFSIYETAYIKCVIEDNGTGRKEHVAKAGKKSLATNFVLQRINLLNQIHNLNCSLLIEDKPNSQGTIVTILLPILNK